MLKIFSISTVLLLTLSVVNPAFAQSSALKGSVLKLDKKQQDSQWQVREVAAACAFVVKHSKAQQSLETKIKLSDENCESMVATHYQLLSNNVLFVNWSSERGGMAYLFSLAGSQLANLQIPYLSGDEDTLIAKVKDNTILLSSNTDKFVVNQAATGELSLSKKSSKAK